VIIKNLIDESPQLASNFRNSFGGFGIPLKNFDRLSFNLGKIILSAVT
jgi:hypothetical protein